MKTDILKLNAVILAIAMACTAHAMQPNEPFVHEIHTGQTEEEFIESMFLQIRDAVTSLADLVENFVDKNNKESFSAFINRCQDRINHIEKNILAPLKYELEQAKAVAPHSNYCKILELTFNLANEMAYKEIKTLHTILDTHRKSADAKKATVLVGALKPHLTKLTSVATLDLLDKKLSEISALLPKGNLVTNELDQLKKMVKDIKTKTATIQNKVNIELLPIISAKLKKP